MNLIQVTCAAGILLVGTMVPAYAQRDQQGDKQGNPEKQDKGGPRVQQPQQRQQQEQARPPQRAQQPQRAKQRQQKQAQEPRREQQPQRPVQQQRPQQQQRSEPQRAQQQPQRAQQPQRTQQQARAWQQQRGWQQQGAWQGHNSWQQNRARNWASDHRTWSQRGGYGGYYIPQDRFSLYFGSQHFFRIHNRPVIYMGYPRFEYGGFSFLLVDPWPEYWAETWYDSDDVYIDYDDGYYLYNRRYPQIRLAVTIML